MIDVKEHIPLAPLTTFEIGGNARYFVDVRNEKEIREAISWAREHGVGFVVLGGGSNVLVPDEGVEGFVIHLVEGEHAFTEQGHTAYLEADAGCNLFALIREAAGLRLGGWEKLAGIPGTIGGAVRGNAGAFGTEIKDVVMAVRALHAETFEVRDFNTHACDFSYRHSFFKDHPEWIITKVFVALPRVRTERQGNPDTVASSIDETIHERERRHLQNVRAAGSYFMNPLAPRAVVELFENEKNVASRENRVPAGWLIEKAGMKGAMVGGAIASMQHPNYLVNQGGATARDVRELAEKIKTAVHASFGVFLQEEAAFLS